jgi:D-beta-D-heptose 7-phosphate kinase/D-beta-D-heptose 1-phosphate adenosyltransferase
MPGTDNKALLEALGRFPQLKVLVVGDVMLDHFVMGRVSRISPEAPVPVVEVVHDHFTPGGAANVVCNLAALGARVAICGLVGRDTQAKQLRSLLAGLGADTAGLITDRGRPTTLKVRVVSRGSMSGAPQQLLRIDREVREPLPRRVRSEVFDYLRRAVREADGVIVSDYGKGLLDATFVADLREAAGPEKLIAVDPKVSHFSWYRGASVATPNLRETEQASGVAIDGPEGLQAAAERLLAELASPWLLVTQGEKGMSLFSRDGTRTRAEFIAAQAPRQVFDVTGAGDTVIAAFTLGMAAGLAPASAARLANLAAGVVVGELGTATVSADTLAGLLR